jgi:hypothetical protein
MKREDLLIVIESAVARAMHDVVQAHSAALHGYRAQSLEKRLIGALGSEMLRAMGHPTGTKLRAPGERYRPSRAACAMQRLQDLAARPPQQHDLDDMLPE